MQNHAYRVRGSVQPATHGALMEVLSANLIRKGGVSWKINSQDRKELLIYERCITFLMLLKKVLGQKHTPYIPID